MKEKHMSKYSSYNRQKNYLRYRAYREISRNPYMAKAYWWGVLIGIGLVALIFSM